MTDDLEVWENRRAKRVVTEMWTKFAGLDSAGQKRRGDISTSGISLEMDLDLGGPGTVHWLEIAASDGSNALSLMARVVRTVGVDDKRAVAMEFLPESPAKKTAIDRLVRRVLVLANVVDEVISTDLEPMPAAVYSLTVHRMELETSWPMQPGEIVQVVFRSKDRTTKLPFEGTVQAIKATTPGRWAALVEVGTIGQRAVDEISQSVDLIFNPEEDEESSEHFSGLLSRIQLPSIFSLFELERSSGCLEVNAADSSIAIWFSQGQIVDVDGEGSPKAVLAQALDWRDGSFKFVAQDVDREDKIGLPTTHLLLELFKAQDEANR